MTSFANLNSIVSKGIQYFSNGQLSEAELLFTEAITINPRDDRLLNFLANTLVAQLRYADALPILEKAISINKRIADYHLGLGICLGALSRLNEAITEFERALKLAPGRIDFLFNLAKAQLLLERFDLAEDSFSKLVRLNPGDINSCTALAIIYLKTGKLDAAQSLFSDLVAIFPNQAWAHFGYATALLMNGHLEAGWKEYLYRPARETLLTCKLPPELNQDEVMILGEQGLGDQLFFLRWLPLLIGKIKKVHVYCDHRLVNILQRSFPAVFFSPIEQASDISKCILMGDLPYLTHNSEYLPPLTLAVHPNKLVEWKQKLAAFAPPPYTALTYRAGVKGTKMDDNFFYKEVSFQTLSKHMPSSNTSLISIQINPLEDEISDFSKLVGQPILDLSLANHDLEDALAIMSICDDYVCVSNTNLHLRAGAGKHSHVLSPLAWEFRYHKTILKEGQSPWFPKSQFVPI